MAGAECRSRRWRPSRARESAEAPLRRLHEEDVEDEPEPDYPEKGKRDERKREEVSQEGNRERREDKNDSECDARVERAVVEDGRREKGCTEAAERVGDDEAVEREAYEYHRARVLRIDAEPHEKPVHPEQEYRGEEADAEREDLHFAGKDLRAGVFPRTVRFVFLLEGEGERGEAVGGEVDPDDLQRRDGKRQPDKKAAAYKDDGIEAGGSEIDEDLADVLEDTTAFLDGDDDGREVVIEKDETGHAFRDISAAAERDADIHRFERRRVVDAVSRHRDDLAACLIELAHAELVFRRHAREYA